jgi:hypothetical protein
MQLNGELIETGNNENLFYDPAAGRTPVSITEERIYQSDAI